VSKETYYSVKRDLLQCQKRPIKVPISIHVHTLTPQRDSLTMERVFFRSLQRWWGKHRKIMHRTPPGNKAADKTAKKKALLITTDNIEDVSSPHNLEWSSKDVCVRLFTAAVPTTKLFAWGEGDSGGHVLWETTSWGSHVLNAALTPWIRL
jgi:hypothetical protein